MLIKKILDMDMLKNLRQIWFISGFFIQRAIISIYFWHNIFLDFNKINWKVY